MKIYEKPSVEIRKFESEDVILASAPTVDQIKGSDGSAGIVFKWLSGNE